MTRGFSRAPRIPDNAPMVITRLSGWINVGDSKAVAPSWIVPTRARERH